MIHSYVLLIQIEYFKTYYVYTNNFFKFLKTPTVMEEMYTTSAVESVQNMVGINCQIATKNYY
jgi:hypothetical protein